MTYSPDRIGIGQIFGFAAHHDHLTAAPFLVAGGSLHAYHLARLDRGRCRRLLGRFGLDIGRRLISTWCCITSWRSGHQVQLGDVE